MGMEGIKSFSVDVTECEGVCIVTAYSIYTSSDTSYTAI